MVSALAFKALPELASFRAPCPQAAFLVSAVWILPGRSPHWSHIPMFPTRGAWPQDAWRGLKRRSEKDTQWAVAAPWAHCLEGGGCLCLTPFAPCATQGVEAPGSQPQRRRRRPAPPHRTLPRCLYAVHAVHSRPQWPRTVPSSSSAPRELLPCLMCRVLTHSLHLCPEAPCPLICNCSVVVPVVSSA